MSSKLVDLKKKLAKITDRSDPYTKGGRLIPLPDKSVIEQKVEPKQQGLERGANDLPPLGTTEPDEVERQLLSTYNEMRSDTAQRASEIAATFNTRIQSIDLTTFVDEVRDSCKSAIEDFRELIMQDERRLKQKFLPIQDKERDFKIFRADQGIRRSPSLPSAMRSQMGYAVIALLFLGESIANASFLAVGNQGGLLGAYGIAFSFSLVNLGSAYFVADTFLRWRNDKSDGRRYAGWLFSIIAFVFAALLSLSLAHFRDVAVMGVGENNGVTAMENLVSAPFNLRDMQSWILFLLGWGFWVIAAVDVYGLDDPIPGYGSISRAKVKAHKDYDDFKADLLADLSDRRLENEDEIKSTRRHLSDLQAHLASLIESRAALISQWQEFGVATAAQFEELLSAYRMANRESRSKSPKSLSMKLSLVQPDFTLGPLSINQETVSSQVEEGKKRLLETQEQFYEEYRRALDIFERIETSLDTESDAV